MDNIKITFIGCGNMGSSLIGGLIADGFNKDHLAGAEPDAARRQAIAERFGIEVLEDNHQACHGADIIVFAVKPQMLGNVAKPLASLIREQGSLVVTVAAGIRTAHLANWLGEETAIVRAMPNTPALILAGATALFANLLVSQEQKSQTEAILRSVGLTIWLDNEDLMDAVTAVSGSGPAYFFLIMEVMEKAALKLGLDREQARLLILQTAFGAAKMALESEHDAEALRQQVTSPGGTTEQALKILTGGDLEQLFIEALKAAEQRSRELANLYGEEQTG